MRKKLLLAASELKWILAGHLDGIEKRVYNRQSITLEPSQPSRGRALFSYSIRGFFVPNGQRLPNTHVNIWRSVQMARTFVDLGFTVDVISHANHTDEPDGDYDVMVDIGVNLARMAPRLSEKCLKIMFIEKSHLLFQNAAEFDRLLALQQRRGITLAPRRFEMPNRAIEHADCAITIGNSVTLDAFRYAGKPVYRIPQFGTECPWPENKDWEGCRRNFVWFGSKAVVLKGLDLVLEAFARMPDHRLYVVGPIDFDKPFRKAFHKELFETPNIETVGWVDIESPKLMEIANRCIGLIYPSASECGSSSTVQCMHAGLIPVVSRECAVDVCDFGFLMEDCSIEGIQESVRKVSSLPKAELAQRARRTWEQARANHTRERFANEFRRMIEKILGDHGK